MTKCGILVWFCKQLQTKGKSQNKKETYLQKRDQGQKVIKPKIRSSTTSLKFIYPKNKLDQTKF